MEDYTSDPAFRAQIAFTPAERAVMREQAQTLRVDLAGLIADLEAASPSGSDIADAWVKCGGHVNYLSEMVSRKVTVAFQTTFGGQ